MDVSKLPDKVDFNRYSNPNSVLKLIADGLPELTSLDISATNLAGNGVFEYNQYMNGVQHNGQREHEDGSGNDSMNASDQEQEETNQMDADTSESDTKNKMREMPKCDIVGLISRVDKPLDFLGLYKCIYQPSYRAHIPAKEVGGIK